MLPNDSLRIGGIPTNGLAFSSKAAASSAEKVFRFDEIAFNPGNSRRARPRHCLCHFNFNQQRIRKRHAVGSTEVDDRFELRPCTI